MISYNVLESIAERLDCSVETCVHSVRMFSEFCALNKKGLEEKKTYFAACFFIASKFNDNGYVDPFCFEEAFDIVFEKVLDAEIDVLKTLEFKIWYH